MFGTHPDYLELNDNLPGVRQGDVSPCRRPKLTQTGRISFGLVSYIAFYPLYTPIYAI
jgi:hypothetical protein